MNSFLLGGKDASIKSSYIWNTIGGMLNACQSALLLIVISRTNSTEDAGVFSIAYAIACLAVTMGKYGMRNYQATDIKEKYTYDIYVYSRFLTSIGMVLILGYYIIKGIIFLNYDTEKWIVVLLLGLMKLLDAVEDIVHGRLQQVGRFEIGAKCMAVRYMITLGVYAVMLFLVKNLVIATLVSFLVSFLFMLYTFRLVIGYTGHVSMKTMVDKKVFFLLGDCASLALGSFLMMYTTNAPKYAIDEYLGSDIQACFNYIFMPVNIVSVLSTFIYQPLLTKLAINWDKGDYKSFMRLFFRQIFVILLLVICVLLGGYFLGIPLLGILYNTDLTAYLNALMILLLGSGCLALLSYFGVVLTIMRKQKWLLVGYILIAVSAFLTAGILTRSYGVIGASIQYLISVCVCMLIFGGLFIVFYIKEKSKNGKSKVGL